MLLLDTLLDFQEFEYTSNSSVLLISTLLVFSHHQSSTYSCLRNQDFISNSPKSNILCKKFISYIYIYQITWSVMTLFHFLLFIFIFEIHFPANSKLTYLVKSCLDAYKKIRRKFASKSYLICFILPHFSVAKEPTLNLYIYISCHLRFTF